MMKVLEPFEVWKRLDHAQQKANALGAANTYGKTDKDRFEQAVAYKMALSEVQEARDAWDKIQIVPVVNLSTGGQS